MSCCRRFITALLSIAQPLLCCTLISSLTVVVQAQTKRQAFEVATVRRVVNADPSTGSWSPPGNGLFRATHVPLTILIQLAYGIDKSQIVNEPDWLGTNLYDVEAKPEDGVKLSREELQPMLQSLLADRFHLRAHMEQRLTSGFALLISKEGVRLKPTRGDHFPGFRSNVSSGNMYGFNWTTSIFAKYLTDAAGFPVVDETGLTGSYDVAFSYGTDSDDSNSQPDLQSELKRVTGLFLKPQKVSVNTLVIDSLDPNPTAN